MTTFTILIDRPTFEVARMRLAAEQSIDIVGDNGEIEHDTALGTVKIAFSFDGMKVLTCTIEEAPIFTSGKIERDVRKWFREPA